MTTPTPEQIAAGQECQAVWRCAIGDATAALDILKEKWVNSRRKHERAAGAELSAVLDLVWAARDPAPSNYNEANDAGKVMRTRIRAAILKEQENG